MSLRVQVNSSTGCGCFVGMYPAKCEANFFRILVLFLLLARQDVFSRWNALHFTGHADNTVTLRRVSAENENGAAASL